MPPRAYIRSRIAVVEAEIFQLRQQVIDTQEKDKMYQALQRERDSLRRTMSILAFGV